MQTCALFLLSLSLYFSVSVRISLPQNRTILVSMYIFANGTQPRAIPRIRCFRPSWIDEMYTSTIPIQKMHTSMRARIATAAIQGA